MKKEDEMKEVLATANLIKDSDEEQEEGIRSFLKLQRKL